MREHQPQEYQLAKCINCDTIMYDNNTSEQPKFIPPKDTEEMKQFMGDDGCFWGCPKCETDVYLIDVEYECQLT